MSKVPTLSRWWLEKLSWMWKMWNFRWILVIVAVVSDGLLSVALRCEPDCNVNKALGCTVRYIGWGCRRTAFPRYQVAPSKPRDLSITQFSPLNKLTDDVAMNISWRMPVNASSTPLLEGFELTVDVLDVYVSPITQCYHINLTQSLIQDTPQALNEVFFTISCYINRKASDMSARLSSLPHSKNPHLDYVNKNHNVVDMSVRERSVDLCDRDPGVTGTVFLPNPPELHVNLQPSIPPGKYYVRLMQGSYSRDKSVIRIGKNVKRKVVFQNPSILKDGECFGIWVQHENCTTKHYWSPAEPYCINFTAAATTPKPEPSPLPFSESQPSHIDSPDHEGPWLSTTTIIIIVVVVVGILSLGTVAAYLIMKRTAAERYTKVPDVPQNNRVVEDSPITKLLVFYDVSECDMVKSFLKLLKGVKPPSLEIMDFVDENNLFEGSYQWFGTAIEKALHGGGILLIIYSEGLFNLFEAQKRKEYYPKYENNVRHGSLVRRAFDYFQNCIFLSDKEDKVMEHVISLGEYIRDGFFSTHLVKYAGLKRVLVVRDGQTCRLHPGMMSQFLSSLGVSPADIDAALALNSPHSKEFLDTLQRCFRQNTAVTWEDKYGPAEPMKEESNSSSTDSTSLASDSENSSYKGSDSPLSDRWEGKGPQTSSGIETGNYQLYEKHEDELVNWANMAGQCPADIHVDMPADVEDVYM